MFPSNNSRGTSRSNNRGGNRSGGQGGPSNTRGPSAIRPIDVLRNRTNDIVPDTYSDEEARELQHYGSRLNDLLTQVYQHQDADTQSERVRMQIAILHHEADRYSERLLALYGLYARVQDGEVVGEVREAGGGQGGRGGRNGDGSSSARGGRGGRGGHRGGGGMSGMPGPLFDFGRTAGPGRR